MTKPPATPPAPDGRRARRRAGRPPAERVAWNPDTFITITRSTLASVDDIAKRVGVSRHMVYAWQSERLDRTPSKAQLRKLAEVLSDLSGSRITPAQLGKTITKVRFTFA